MTDKPVINDDSEILHLISGGMIPNATVRILWRQTVALERIAAALEAGVDLARPPVGAFPTLLGDSETELGEATAAGQAGLAEAAATQQVAAGTPKTKKGAQGG